MYGRRENEFGLRFYNDDSIKGIRGDGDDLDDYIDREFNRLQGSGDGLRPWRPWNNCKHSAELLIANAKRNKRKDEGKTRPSLDEVYHWYKRSQLFYIIIGIGG